MYLWWIIYLLASCRFFFSSRLQFCLRACYMLDFGVEFWYRWICFLVPYWGGTLASCFTNIKLLIFQSLFSLIIKQFAGVFLQVTQSNVSLVSANSHLKTPVWDLVVVSQTDFFRWGLGGCKSIRVDDVQGSEWGVGLPGVSTIQKSMSL